LFIFHDGITMPKRKQKQKNSSDQDAKKPRLRTQHDPDEKRFSISTPQSAALLKLPGEMRNKIYAQVLTVMPSSSIQITFPRHERRPGESRKHLRPFHLYNTPPEFNQLKYVCRELYNETAALELKHNNLAFSQVARAELEPDLQLLEFTRLCSPTKFAWVQTVELHIKALAMPYREHLSYFLKPHHIDAYIRVAQFCRKHPAISVKYILNSFTWLSAFHVARESQGFINQGIVLQKTLRNKNLSWLRPGMARYLLEEGADLRGRRKVQSWFAENLKFFPRKEAFDEKTFRRGARGVTFEGVKGGVDTWIATAKEWCEDGF
jgi:hypothetical protein